MELTPHPAEGNKGRPNVRQALAAVLLLRQTRLWPRFLSQFVRLQRLPRGWRRRIGRKTAVTLAGVALLLALGRTPSTNIAHAANITVVDGEVAILENDLCSLIEAIENANGGAIHDDCVAGDAGGDDIILPANGSFTITDDFDDYYDSDTGLPLITSEITIEGNGSTIERQSLQLFRLLAVSADGVLTLNNTTLSGGFSEEAGGALYNYQGTVTSSFSTFNYNESEGDGGALAANGGVTKIDNGIFAYNFAQSDGGALAQFDGGYLTIIRSSLHDNGTDDAGGGIFNDAGTLVIEGGSIGDNSSVGDGGGLYSKGGMATLTDVVITNNEATGTNADGGAVINSPGNKMTITNSTLINNEVTGTGSRGGAILNDETAELTILSSTLTGNTAGRDGGALFNDGGNVETYVTIINSTISNNQAVQEGGGINGDDGAVTTVINSTIFNNNSLRGGGVHVDDGSVTTLTRSIVSGNIANNGDEVFNEGGTVNAANFNLFGNSVNNNAASFVSFTPSGSDLNATSDGLNVPLIAILDTNLEFNGGPTATHALVENSPVIDAAPSADCDVPPVNGLDQRGYLRGVDGDNTVSSNECDIGAFEYASARPQFIYMTAAGPGVTDDGVPFGQEDILFWDGANWSNVFDGTDEGLTTKHDLNAIHVNAADDLYLSFFQNKIKTATLGTVLGHDILHFDGSSFSFFFDGSDVGLTTVGEKVDALHVLDGSVSPIGGSCDYYLLISTLGTGKVPAFGGGQLSFQGEDILGFCMTNTGDNTAGFWHLVLDGSAEGMPKNSTDSISATADGETILLTTKDTFNVDTAFGGHSMIYLFDTDNGEFDGPLFSAPANGLNQKVDGLHGGEGLLN